MIFPKLFADTSDLNELKSLLGLGIFSGITTNPLIVAREAGKANPSSYYEKIAVSFPNIPVSISLLDEPIEMLIKHAEEYASIAPNVVVKVPMFENGKALIIIRELVTRGIKVNCTALMKKEQTLLTLLAGKTDKSPGPSYISLFFGRIKDFGSNPINEIKRSRDMIDKICPNTEIITGSIRDGSAVFEAIDAGAHIVTVPPKIIWEMIKHPKSSEFIKQSQTEWENYLKSRK